MAKSKKHRPRHLSILLLIALLAGIVIGNRLCRLDINLTDFIKYIKEKVVPDDDPEGTPEIHQKSSPEPAPIPTTKPPTRRSQPMEGQPPPENVKRLYRGVVRIRSLADKPTLTADGRYVSHFDQSIGFAVWRDNHKSLLITAGHAIVSKAVEIRSKGVYLPADLVALDRHVDLALIRVSKRSLTPEVVFKIASQSVLDSGSPCWVLTVKGATDSKSYFLSGRSLGVPRGLDRTIKWSYGPNKPTTDWFALSQATQRGQSGAPVLDESGKVAGVLVAGIQRSSVEIASLAVHARALKEFLRANAPAEFP